MGVGVVVFLMIMNESITCFYAQCSSGCGTGVQQREVVCVQSTSAGLTILPDTECVAEDKPTTSGSCQNDACGAQWYMTSWTEVISVLGQQGWGRGW